MVFGDGVICYPTYYFLILNYTVISLCPIALLSYLQIKNFYDIEHFFKSNTTVGAVAY